MSDMTYRGNASPETARRRAARLRPLVPYPCAVLAGAAGVLGGHALGGDAAAYDDKLLLVLRFMAAMKFAGVVAAAGLLHWRLTRDIGWSLGASYAVALIAMALAAGLIWSLGAIATGALLFHAGLLSFLVLAWRDDAVGRRRR